MKALPRLSGVIFILLFTAFSFGQIPTAPNKGNILGQREGLWTLLFDKDWKEVTDTSIAAYYRIVTYSANKPIGKVKDYYKSGKIQWEGELVSDRPDVAADGRATWYYENGNKLAEGEYLKNKIRGRWREWFENGNKNCEGNLVDDKEDSLWHYYYSNNKLRTEILYRKGKIWEVYSLFDKYGNLVDKGNFRLGTGFLISYNENGGKKSEHNYIEGILDGHSIDYSEQGFKQSEGNYKDGKKEGQWKEWNIKGALWEGNYVGDLKEGIWKNYDENLIYLGYEEYKNGVKAGEGL